MSPKVSSQKRPFHFGVFCIQDYRFVALSNRFRFAFDASDFLSRQNHSLGQIHFYFQPGKFGLPLKTHSLSDCCFQPSHEYLWLKNVCESLQKIISSGAPKQVF